MWEKFLEILKVLATPKTYVAFAIASGFFLFANSRILSYLGYDTINDQIKPYVGAIFVVSIALLISSAIFSVFKFINKKLNVQLYKKSSYKRLRRLTFEEKEIFLGYILENKRTQFFQMMDGVALGLEREHFIFRAINAASIKGVPYNIESWVWDFLIKNSDEIFSKDDIDSYKKSNLNPSEKSNKRVNPLFGL